MSEMAEDKLAIDGGTPVISAPFRRYNSLGPEEQRAVNEVMETGVLSQFLGCWHDDFYGGAKVREFEAQLDWMALGVGIVQRFHRMHVPPKGSINLLQIAALLAEGIRVL